MTTATKIKERYNRGLEFLGVMISKFSRNAKLDKDVFEHLQITLPDNLFQTVIADSVKHREATFHRWTIVEHCPKHDAAHQYRALAAELRERIAAKENQRSLTVQAEAQNG